MYIVPCTLYLVRCTLWQGTMYTYRYVLCTMYIVALLCTSYLVLCTMYLVPSAPCLYTYDVLVVALHTSMYYVLCTLYKVHQGRTWWPPSSICGLSLCDRPWERVSLVGEKAQKASTRCTHIVHISFHVYSYTTHIRYIRVLGGETKIQRAQNFRRLAQDTAWLELGTS